MSDSLPARGRLARALDLWPYALIALLYLATSPYHQGLNNPNEMVRVYMTRALADDGTFAIDAVIRDWGGVDDKALRDGKLYSSKAPFQSLLGVPIYEVAPSLLSFLSIEATKRHLTMVLRIFGSAIFGIAFAAILLAWSRRRAVELGAPRDLGTATGLVLALGTMLYPYSITFTGHTLAAFAAGGCYLAVIALSRAEPSSRAFDRWALVAGFAAGASPFCEYPAALLAGPAIVGAFAITPTWSGRSRLFLFLGLGGAIPFGVGLWSHHELWGSALRTGYSFLENTGYVEVHGEGFFGVTYPKPEALGGSLFSPGTGLFFFSPILMIGLAMLVVRVFTRDRAAPEPDPADDMGTEPAPVEPRSVHRTLAIVGLVAFVLELLFIAGHRGWRGGWTVGPRYIIPVAPLLGLWAVEALAVPKVRAWIASFGALSIAMTAFAAALYPHLSDVYTNPIKTFLVPSYLAGEMTYGLGYWAGLRGAAANLVHVVPLTFALAYVSFAGLHAEPRGLSRFARGPTRRRILALLITAALGAAVVVAVPEKDPVAARRENRRLWGFWEPARPGDGPNGARRDRRPGLMWRGRSRWRAFEITHVTAQQQVRACVKEGQDRCRYGDQPWQHFGPDTLDMDGVREPILFLHPIAGAKVRAQFPVNAAAKRMILRYGMADASVASDNVHPIQLTLSQNEVELARAEAGNTPGLHALEWVPTSTAPVTLTIEVERDGARVFGFDVEAYRE